MEYRACGRNGLNVSALGFGAWQLGDPAYWGEDSEVDGDAAVHAALDAGVNFFDTAEMYGDGRSEEVLGRALGKRRGEAIIASKFLPQHSAPEAVRRAYEGSLRRLGTDYLDLYQVHWPARDVPFEDTWAALDSLRAEGKIRAIGVSNFGARDLGAWFRMGDAATNQLGYNLLFRAIEHEIVLACERHGVGILAYMPLMQGLLAGRWQSVGEIPVSRRRTRHFSGAREGTRHGEPGCEALLLEAVAGIADVARERGRPMAEVALAWLMARPGVVSVLAGARKPAQVLRNLKAAEAPLDAVAVARLDAITESLRAYFGDNADLWQSTAQCRIR